MWPELNNLTSMRGLEFGGNEIESFKSIHGRKELWVNWAFVFTHKYSIILSGYMKAYGIFIGTGDELLRLRNLEHLVLNGTRFNDSSLSSLKGLSSLKYLNIGYNQLKGSFNVTGNLTFFDS